MHREDEEIVYEDRRNAAAMCCLLQSSNVQVDACRPTSFSQVGGAVPWVTEYRRVLSAERM